MATSITLTEGQQEFRFDHPIWDAVVKYDETAVHKDILRQITGTKAVDFIAIGSNTPSIALVEVKDFRGATGANRVRLKSSLAKEVAEKVAGTLIGVSSASRGNRSDFPWRQAGQHLTNPNRRLVVVIHVESDDWHRVEEAKAQLGVLAAQLERALTWLPECRVIATCERLDRVPSCAVTTQ